MALRLPLIRKNEVSMSLKTVTTISWSKLVHAESKFPTVTECGIDIPFHIPHSRNLCGLVNCPSCQSVLECQSQENEKGHIL